MNDVIELVESNYKINVKSISNLSLSKHCSCVNKVRSLIFFSLLNLQDLSQKIFL